jgi:hypothetical protein
VGGDRGDSSSLYSSMMMMMILFILHSFSIFLGCAGSCCVGDAGNARYKVRIQVRIVPKLVPYVIVL